MRLQISLALVVLVVAFESHLLADEDKLPRQASIADAGRVARQEELQILNALSQRITLDCHDLPLNEAVHQLSELIDREILFDAVTLVDGGISMDQNVSLNLGKTTAWQALHFLLKPMRLTWIAQDGILEITTEEKADDVFVTRVYDVKHLCEKLEPLTREMSIRHRRGKPQPPVGGGMGGGGFFSIPGGTIDGLTKATIGQFGGLANVPAHPMPPKPVEGVLADVIRACSSLLWEDDADDVGSIQLGQGCLIIRQTYRGHFEIAGMLQALEQFVDGKAQGKSIAAGRIGYPTDEDAAIFAALAKPRTVQFDDLSLRNVLQEIVRETGLRIWIDETELNAIGVSLDQDLGLRRRMQKLPLGMCLKKILEPLQLTCVVEEGVLVVTTQSRAAEMMSVHFYDISGITKITNEDRNTNVISVLARSTRGRWFDIHSEGGSVALVSSRHLAVRQTQLVHAEISLLIDDLTKESLLVPVDPPFELRVYTAPDANTARDLERLIPQMIETVWNPRGSIRRAGSSLFVDQPPTAHDKLDGIMGKLEQSNLKRNPPNVPNDPHDSTVPDDSILPKK